MSQPVIIGIDHGYAAMKTAHCSFPTGLVAYTHEPYSSDHVLEYDGQFYVIGSGRQALQKDKTATEDYYLLTLAAIAMELEARKLPGEAEVILAAGLPLTSFGRDKKTFRQYLLRDSKPIDFRYEGRPYRITIKDVQPFPQGYSAVIWQPELLEQPSVIVADIGGWTVDLMEVDNQVPNAATYRSLELGVIRCLNEISEQLRRILGLSLTNAQIESVLRGATSSLSREVRELIQKEAERYLTGESYARIADNLNHSGPAYHPEHPLWNKHIVKRILENSKYTGQQDYPQIIDPVQFSAVQNLIAYCSTL